MTVGALPITMAPAAGGHSVATEFGWTVPFSCASKTPRGGVATAGFNLSTFVGKSNFVLATTPVINAHGGSAGVSETTTITINADGSVTLSVSVGSLTAPILNPNWGSPLTAGIGSNYWARNNTVSATGGTLTPATWVQLTSGGTITLSSNSIVVKHFSGTIDFSLTSGGAILATASYDIYAGG